MATGKKVLVNSKVKKSTSLAELEKEDRGPVFAINATTGELNGQILINVPKKHGNGSDIVRIPKTFIPIDLTTQVTRSQLLESSEFRKTVTQGLLKLVTAEYAELVLASEEGRSEKRRIENDLSKTKTILANAGVTEEDGEAQDEDDYVDAADAGRDAKKGKEKASSKDQAAIRLQTLVNSASEDDLTEREIIGKLKTYQSSYEFSRADFDYLAKKYKDKPRLVKWLKEQFAEFKRGTKAEA